MGRRQHKKTAISVNAVDEVVSYANERHQNEDGEITVKRRRIILCGINGEEHSPIPPLSSARNTTLGVNDFEEQSLGQTGAGEAPNPALPEPTSSITQPDQADAHQKRKQVS